MPRLKIAQTCRRCGNLFHPWPKRKNGKPRMFCSPQCKPPLLERFWSNVRKSDYCWTWTAGTDKDGYGQIWKNETERRSRTHRLSWEIHHGPIPDGQHVLHHYDNPPCVRPDHLFLGTNADNNADMVSKKRNPQGDTHGMAKVTHEQVKEIRRRYREEIVSQQRLADEYDLKQTTISQIVRFKVWKNIAP